MATNGDSIPANGNMVFIDSGSAHFNGGQTNGHCSGEINGRRPHTNSISHSRIKTGLHEIILIDELPRETWSLGTAIRPNGDAFITRLNGPELYSVRNLTGRGSHSPSVEPKLIHTFSGVTSVFNVCRLKSTLREEYAVLTGSVCVETSEFQNCEVWRVVPPADDSAEEAEAEVTKIASIPGGQFCIGMAPVSERILLIGDSAAGCIYRLDLVTGISSILYDDESMRPATKKDTVGLGRIALNGNYLFYTNTSRGTLCRLPVQRTEDTHNLEPTGPSEVVASDLVNADGMAVTRDGSTAYIDSYTTGKLWKVDINTQTGNGVAYILRERMPNPTAMELVYKEHINEPTLFVVCCGFVGQQWRDNVGSRWLSMLHVDRSIMVTTETFITYEPNPDYIEAIEDN